MPINPPRWGLRPIPSDALRAWGARAIYTYAGYGHAGVDLVWDRQEAVVAEGVERDDIGTQRFIKWVNKQNLGRWCEDARLLPTEERTIRRTSGPYTIEASPRRSFGYLYLVAWEMPDA